jgi:hypothetical protein
MPEIQALLAANKKLSREMLRANADHIDQSRQFPRENLTALGKSGVLGLLVPTQFGGAGAGLAEMSQVIEAQAQNCAPTAMVTLMHFCATAVIAAKASDALKQEMLPAIACGEHLSTLAFSEAGSGGHFYAPVSEVRRESSHEFVRRSGCRLEFSPGVGEEPNLERRRVPGHRHARFRPRLASKIIVRSDSKLATLADVRGKAVAVGASDSPQATLIALNLIADSGVDPRKDCRVLYNDVMVGKHGDHVGGERDAAKALAAGAADAACILDSNYQMFINEGTLDPGTTTILATTPPFDHCNFTVPSAVSEERIKPLLDALLGMSFQDSSVRVFMELEGLRRWLPGRTTGYVQLEKAVQRFNFYRAAASTAGN